MRPLFCVSGALCYGIKLKIHFTTLPSITFIFFSISYITHVSVKVHSLFISQFDYFTVEYIFSYG